LEFAFSASDEGALGMEMEWKQPPEVIRVGKGTPADARGIRPGDRLVAVNGEDVRTSTRENILPKFRERPLTVRFVREADLLREGMPLIAPEVPPPPFPAMPTLTQQAEKEQEPEGIVLEVTFQKDDKPPLGLDMDWKQPPEVIQVMPATPAAKYKLQARDRLLAVNGVDVTGMPREQILPLFAARPLQLRMLRGGRVKDDVPPTLPALAPAMPAAAEPSGTAPVGDFVVPPEAEMIEIVFTADDKPPLGLDMDWTSPPQVLQVMPDTPASRQAVRAGDQLYKVNGQDVTKMRREEILPLFGARPVTLQLVRLPGTEEQPAAVATEVVDINFSDEDQNPLGLEMEWKTPPEVIRVIQDTPAERRGCLARDRLISVNGQDTTNMTWIQILKLFSNRPLNCRFERDPRAALEAGRSSPGLEGGRKKKSKRDKKREEDDEAPAEPPQTVEAVFTEEDRPPLGLDMDWRQPPEVIQVMASTPAAKHGVKARDKLQTVNGVDVTNLPREQILPLFGQRPLRVTFLREPKRKRKKKRERGEQEQLAITAGPDGAEDEEAPAPDVDPEESHDMAPPTELPGVAEDAADSNARRVPVPSAHFIGRYMARLDERQRSAPKEKLTVTETEGDEEKGKQSRAFVLRQQLDINTWSKLKTFWGITIQQHKGLKWWGPDTQHRRLVRALTFWLYAFTHLYLMALYSRDAGAACNEPPGYPAEIKVDCNFGGHDDEESEDASRRLLAFVAEVESKPLAKPWAHQFRTWGTRYLQADDAAELEGEEMSEEDKEALKQMQIEQCEEQKVVANAAYEYFEECKRQMYMIPSLQLSWTQFWIVLFSSICTSLIVSLFMFSFTKTVIRSRKPIAEKLRIVQFWRLKELFAMVFCVFWICGCVYYLFMYSVNNPQREYATTNFAAIMMQWLKPFGLICAVMLLIYYGAKVPVGRFLLTLVPGVYNLKHMVYEKPEDIVAARRERQIRKEMLRKEVQRLRKRVDENASRSTSRAPSRAGSKDVQK
jgi:C-terminal processing protease CtpA/Prc